MSSLVTGRGGTLLPIGGGLATSEGEIVLDPVLASVTPASFVDGRRGVSDADLYP